MTIPKRAAFPQPSLRGARILGDVAIYGTQETFAPPRSLRPGTVFVLTWQSLVLGKPKHDATGLQDKPLAMTTSKSPHSPNSHCEEPTPLSTARYCGKPARLPTVIARKSVFCPDEAISGTWEPQKRDCYGPLPWPSQ